jgi:hypothetical protein
MRCDKPVTEEIILALAAKRGPGSTFCPSEVARRLGANWRSRMSEVRAAAAALAAKGAIVCTQGGKPVDPLTARGPIRLGQPRTPIRAPSRPPGQTRSLR